MVMRNKLRTASAPARPSATTIAGAQISALPRMRAQLRAHLHVAPDQQVQAAGQDEVAVRAGPRMPARSIGISAHSTLSVIILGQDSRLPAIGRSAESAQQVDRIVVHVVGQAVLDGLNQRRRALQEVLDQPLRVGIDGGVGLAIQQPGGGPPQEGRQRQRAEGANSPA